MFNFIGLILSFHPLVLAAEQALTVDDFVKIVNERNLDLRIETAGATAVEANSRSIGLPPPTVGLIQVKDESGQANGFEIQQTLPFPSRILADKSARELEAKSRGSWRAARHRETIAEARLAFFKLWKAQVRIALLLEKRSALEEHLRLARASSRSDSFLKTHLVKTEGEIDLLANELLQAEQDKLERQFRVVEMSDQSPREVTFIAKEPPLSELPAPGVAFQVQSRQLDLKALEYRETDAKGSWLPELGLRYKEMGATAMAPRSTEIMVSASLPFLYFWGPQSNVHRATADRLQGELALAREVRRIDTQQELLRMRAMNLRQQLLNFRQKLIPRAERRMKLVHNLAPRDMETLIDHRETMESLPELKLRELEVREQFEDAVSELQKVTGDTK